MSQAVHQAVETVAALHPEPERVPDEQLDVLDRVIAGFADPDSALIPVLQTAQDLLGYLPVAVLKHIALRLGKPYSEVTGVVTFYSYFTTVPRGKNLVRVCLGTACYVKRSEEIIEKIKAELDLEVGEITRDKKYSLEAVRCLGACGLAPVVVIGQDTYGDVAATKVMDIIKKYD